VRLRVMGRVIDGRDGGRGIVRVCGVKIYDVCVCACVRCVCMSVLGTCLVCGRGCMKVLSSPLTYIFICR
jgi:hypothetical protein